MVNKYRYPVANGVRLVEIQLQKHVHSDMCTVGNSIPISYEEQALTC
jgi:hypothetical protein